MLAKPTAKNQITIPKDIISRPPDVEYFDVRIRNGAMVSKLLKVYETNLEGIRRKMKKLGISEKSASEALRWAQNK